MFVDFALAPWRYIEEGATWLVATLVDKVPDTLFADFSLILFCHLNHALSTRTNPRSSRRNISPFSVWSYYQWLVLEAILHPARFPSHRPMYRARAVMVPFIPYKFITRKYKRLPCCSCFSGFFCAIKGLSLHHPTVTDCRVRVGGAWLT